MLLNPEGNAGPAALHPKLRQRANRGRIFEADLLRGIREREFLLHYQPKVSLPNRKLIGFEALVRWHHPDYGLLDAEEFIPVAEQTGLVVPLGRWVLKRACRQMAWWQNMLPLEPPLAIGVNTSFSYLRDPRIIPDLRQILAETGLIPRTLRLEMAESSIMTHVEAANATLRELKAMEIGLEIDDFGTGEDSLRYLRKLPFDTLKIDRSFVKELGTANDSSEIIDAILSFAEPLGMEVAAEGVETEEQLHKLTALGCCRGQGYYFSGPVDAIAATALIEDEKRGLRTSIHLV